MSNNLLSNILINGFQYRAARGILNMDAKDIANHINIHHVNFVRFSKTNNFDKLPCHKKTNTSLKLFFMSHDLYFPDQTTISLNIQVDIPSTNSLTRFQLKAARLATRLTQEELGRYIAVSSTTISTLESMKNLDYIDSKVLNTKILKKFFLNIGINFPNDLSISLAKDPYKVFKNQNTN